MSRLYKNGGLQAWLPLSNHIATLSGPNVSKDMDTPHRDQGAIDLTVMPDGSGSLKVERWDSDEVRQTAVESQVSIRHRALELQRPIRLRLSLAAC